MILTFSELCLFIYIYIYINEVHYLRCCSLRFPRKIQSCDYLIKKIHFHLMRKNPHDKILKWEPKEQHLSTIPKSCPSIESHPHLFRDLNIGLQRRSSPNRIYDYTI